MALDRPARPPAGAVSDAVRSAILRRAHEDLGLNAARVLALHTDEDCLADTRALIEDVDRRYRLRAGAMEGRVLARVVAAIGAGVLKAGQPSARAIVFDDRGAGFVLLALPDSEFLTAIEHAVDLAGIRGLYGTSDFSGISDAGVLAHAFFSYADKALAAHGAPYRRVADGLAFEWIGDPKQHEVTVEPALLALGDPRLAGPRAEFDEALNKRRLGAPNDLEDAVDEAAKSVESVLKVLHQAQRRPAGQ